MPSTESHSLVPRALTTFHHPASLIWSTHWTVAHAHNKHSCTLTPTLSAPGSVLMTNAAFSKAVVEVSVTLQCHHFHSFSLP